MRKESPRRRFGRHFFGSENKLERVGRPKIAAVLFQGQGLDGALIHTGAAVYAGVLIHGYFLVLHTESFAGASIYTGTTTRAFVQIHL